MRDSVEDFNKGFASALDYNPSIKPETDSPCPALTSTLTFYDKHLDERLALKMVTLIPSFVSQLSQFVDKALKTVIEEDVDMPSVKEYFPSPTYFSGFLRRRPIEDAQAIGQVHQIMVASLASHLASMFSLHPNASTWSSVMRMAHRPITRHQDYYAFNEDFSPELLLPYDDEASYKLDMIPQASWEAMNDVQREELEQVMKRFPSLAVWQLFFPRDVAETLLKAVDEIASEGTYSHTTFSTIVPGSESSKVDLPPAPDASNTAWTAFLLSLDQSPSPDHSHISGASPTKHSDFPDEKPQLHKIRSGIAKKTMNIKRSKVEAVIHSWPNVTVPKSTNTDLLGISMLQHAWTRAVERDASFLVFHTGTLERIAFRHRSSQTLFVSELVDVTHCKNPAYGKIHVGLYMALLEDVLDRTRQLVRQEAETARHKNGKRKKSASQTKDDSKRPKTRKFVAMEAARRMEYLQTFQTVCDALPDRPLALLRIMHHHYNSPVPASFLRISDSRAPLTSKSAFNSQEYFNLTITSEIGHGATGDTHAATIELVTPEGKTVSFPDAVVKLAFKDDQQKRMRHEFRVYEHLISHEVKGIPHIFGLFEDVESNTLALVMENVGTPLNKKRREGGGFTISDAERDGLATILRGIHDAGVRHRDIRAENLVISDDGVPRIIDFDIAHILASETSRQREHEYLVELLEGKAPPLDYTLGSTDRDRLQRYYPESDASETDEGLRSPFLSPRTWAKTLERVAARAQGIFTPPYREEPDATDAHVELDATDDHVEPGATDDSPLERPLDDKPEHGGSEEPERGLNPLSDLETEPDPGMRTQARAPPGSKPDIDVDPASRPYLRSASV